MASADYVAALRHGLYRLICERLDAPEAIVPQ
jgi:hypothetical protein